MNSTQIPGKEHLSIIDIFMSLISVGNAVLTTLVAIFLQPDYLRWLVLLPEFLNQISALEMDNEK